MLHKINKSIKYQSTVIADSFVENICVVFQYVKAESGKYLKFHLIAADFLLIEAFLS